MNYFFPFLILAIISLFYLIFYNFNFFKNGQIFEKFSEGLLIKITYSRLATVSFTVVTILCFPDIIKSGLLLFNCENVGDLFEKEFRMSEDLSVNCKSKSHKFWSFSIGLLGLAFYGLYFPLHKFIKLVIYKKKNKIDNKM